ncbi:Arabinogalactan protein 16 [Glycine soja]
MQWTPLRITGLIGCLYPLLLPLRNGLLNPCAVSHQFSFGFGVVAAVVLSLIFTLYMPVAVHAQSLAPAPAPTSDGTSIDQGIAYVLMMLALALTYLIHSSTF